MTDERMQEIVAMVIDKTIEANRDFIFEIDDSKSSILGTMQKREGLVLSIKSFVEAADQTAELDFCEDDEEDLDEEKS